MADCGKISRKTELGRVKYHRDCAWIGIVENRVILGT